MGRGLQLWHEPCCKPVARCPSSPGDSELMLCMAESGKSAFQMCAQALVTLTLPAKSEESWNLLPCIRKLHGFYFYIIIEVFNYSWGFFPPLFFSLLFGTEQFKFLLKKSFLLTLETEVHCPPTCPLPRCLKGLWLSQAKPGRQDLKLRLQLLESSIRLPRRHRQEAGIRSQ